MPKDVPWPPLEAESGRLRGIGRASRRAQAVNIRFCAGSTVLDVNRFHHVTHQRDLIARRRGRAGSILAPISPSLTPGRAPRGTCRLYLGSLPQRRVVRPTFNTVECHVAAPLACFDPRRSTCRRDAQRASDDCSFFETTRVQGSHNPRRRRADKTLLAEKFVAIQRRHCVCTTSSVNANSMSLQERIIHLEAMLERFARERADVERVDRDKAQHIAEASENLRVVLARLKAHASANLTRDDVQ